MTPDRPGRTVRGPARIALFLAVLGLVPLVLLVVAHRAAAERVEDAEPPSSPPAAAIPTGRVTTPLLSARRVPAALQRDVAVQNLRAALLPVAAQVPTGSCLGVAVDGRPVFGVNGPAAVMPASNMKLVTAAVALDALGPAYRFTTTVKSAAAPVGGRLDGDLYLVGSGDPVLGTADYLQAAKRLHYPQPFVTPLETLADQIKAAGVTHVSGRVVGDDRHFDAERYVPSWPAGYATAREAGPLGALMVNDAAAGFSPFRNAADPATHAADELTALLEARGVTVEGGATRGAAPVAGPTLGHVQSRPVSELVGEMLTTSDANTAELLLKQIGAAKGGAGTRAAGLAVVQSTLQRWGIPLTGVHLVDGSGLDRGNRLTCDAILALLDHVGPNGPLAAGLPVAGRTGTLATELRESPAAGRLRAKTGTLTGAKALSGFVDAADGRRHVSFSYVQNGPAADAAAEPVWTALGAILTTYPQAPAAAALGPTAPVAA